MNCLVHTLRSAAVLDFPALDIALSAGCASLRGADNPIVLNPNSISGSSSAILLPGADYHLVTVRTHPGRAGQPAEPVLCSEPSPDWAVAFGKALGGTASGRGPGGATGSLNATASTTNSIIVMIGRTAGVVALRDGLYTACQAYANGVIGKDAYSLILSQYGNLLVALAGGGVAATEAPKASAPASGAPSGAASLASAQGGSGAATSCAGTAGTGNVHVNFMQQQALQAMLVACISEMDPTVERGSGNELLQTKCPAFLQAFGGKIPDLLKPAVTGQDSGGVPPARKK
jgi:hypothetical protein